MPFCNTEIVTADASPNKIAVRVICKRWSCPRCSELLRSRLVKRLIEGQPNRILTLTLRRTAHQKAEHAAKNLPIALRRIIERERRHHPTKTYAYAAVVERTELGWPHAHVALRSPYIVQQEVSTWMRKHYDSPVVGIEEIEKQKGVAAYMSKYLVKDPERFGSMKRFWFSQNYDLSKPPKLETVREWWRQAGTLEEWCHYQAQHGYAVELRDHVTAIARPL